MGKLRISDFVTFWLTLWACYLFAEQQTIALLMTIKSSYTAISASVAATTIYLVLGSATVRYHVKIYDSPNVILIFF